MNLKISLLLKGIRGVRTLEALTAAQIYPIIVIDQLNDKEVQAHCRKFMIEYHSEILNSKINLFELMHQKEVNLVLLAGYSKILKRELYSRISIGVLNCHGGRLPEYRGASPIPWQIIMGETSGECYILGVQEGIDSGPIYSSRKYEILQADDATTITELVSNLIAEMYVEVVNKLRRGNMIKLREQSNQGIVNWTRRYESDGRIDWSLNNSKIINLIRGLTNPYPGAFTFRKNEKITIVKAQYNHVTYKGVPGRYVGKSQFGIIVCTGESSIIIEKVKIMNQQINAVDLGLLYGETFTMEKLI